MSVKPTGNSDSIYHPEFPTSSPPLGGLRNSLYSQSTISPVLDENCCSNCFSTVSQWMRKTFLFLFPSTVTRRILAAQDLELRIHKGREFINSNIDHHFGNHLSQSDRDRFLVIMSYNGDTVIEFPPSSPIDLNQLKRNAFSKFESMMRQPNHLENSGNDQLSVRTYSFTRTIRPSDGALSPFVVCESEFRSRYFRNREDRDSVATGGIWRPYDHEFRSWIEDHVPTPAHERQTAIDHVLGVLPHR
jgi:hypothetical protein